MTAFQLSAHGAAMLKCNDTGSLEELIPRPAEDAPDGDSAEGSAGTPSGGAAGEPAAAQGTAGEATATDQGKGAAQA